MTSNAVIAARALRRLKVIGAGATPSAESADDAVQALVDMHASWNAEGLVVPALPLDERFDQGLVAMLAVRLAEDYGKTPGPVLTRDAQNGEAQIHAAFFPVPASRFDNTIIHTGHYADVGYIIGAGDENYMVWEPNTDYALRRYVRNGANLYESTVAGTSAATGGPTGTDQAIVDGTVTWVFRRVVGEPEPESL
jgi:hypothetical protein